MLIAGKVEEKQSETVSAGKDDMVGTVVELQAIDLLQVNSLTKLVY